jgi:hypothetical protein
MLDSSRHNKSRRVEFNWASVSSLSKLKSNMIRYLKGEHPTSPWHFIPLNEETTPLIGNLIKLNDMGFITTQGQPTEYIYPARYRAPNDNIGTLIEIKHGYIEGILDTRKYSIPKLIENIKKDPSVCALLYKFTEKRNKVYNLPNNPCIIKRTADEPTYGVTRYLNDTTGDVEYYTKIRYTDLKGGGKIIIDNTPNNNLRDEINDNCYFICFIDNREPTQFNPRPEITLEQKIIDILNDISENAIINRVLARPRPSVHRTRRRTHRRSSHRLSRINENNSYRS